MTNAEKYANVKAIGYYGMNNFGGLEVLEFQHDIDNDYVIVCFNFGEGRRDIRKCKLYETETETGRRYFTRYGIRYYLDEIMRNF